MYLGDDGSATTAMLDSSPNHLVIGRVCEGICVLDDLSELMSSTKWVKRQLSFLRPEKGVFCRLQRDLCRRGERTG